MKNEGLIRFYGLGFHRSLKDTELFGESLINLSMFNKEMVKRNENSSSFSIIHGAMAYYKFAMDQIEKNKYDGPSDFLNKLTELHPSKTFLIAPSNNRQILDLKL